MELVGPDPAKQTFGRTPPEAREETAQGPSDTLGAASEGSRPLRVLHVGNVANNAYSVSRLLRRAGVESMALVVDYYHIMGCPEWEAGEMDQVPSDHFFPDWRDVNLRDFERPRWFVQGPLAQCASYLEAVNGGSARDRDAAWQRLEMARQLLCSKNLGLARRVVERAKDIAKSLPGPLESSARRAWKGLVGTAGWLLESVGRARHPGDGEAQREAEWPVPVGASAAAAAPSWAPAGPAQLTRDAFAEHCRALVADFKARFPDRPDQLSLDELLPYYAESAACALVMARFDVVQAYGSDVLKPMLAGKRPYVAFEHGTLRDYTTGDCTLHRLTALAYARADHVFITNGDCLSCAEKIGVTRYSPMIHPVDESLYRNQRTHPGDLRQHFGVDVLLYCPIRHDWTVKGTDVFIRLLPELRKRLAGRTFKLVFSPWGADVERSRALVRELACEDLVEWHGPFHRQKFIRMIRACDVVLDQMILPCFGATAPEAIASGTPVIMSYDQKSTDWIIDEPAPILSARTQEQALDCIMRALDPDYREQFRQTSWQWFLKNHSAQRLIDEHVRVYQSVAGRPFRPASTDSEI